MLLIAESGLAEPGCVGRGPIHWAFREYCLGGIMTFFDTIIDSVSERYGLGRGTVSRLLSELLGLISNKEYGGFTGFLTAFQNNGLGDAVDSWVGEGTNTAVTEGEVEKALGNDILTSLASGVGIGRETILPALTGMIPLVVDRLTPDGGLPSEESLMATIAGFSAEPEPARRPVVVEEPEPIAPADGSDRLISWLLPLILLAILVALGIWFCGKSTPTSNVNTAVNDNANFTPANANANTTAPAVESSFKLEARDGKYIATGVVPDQKTFDDIKAALDAQFGAGNVDLSGLKIDAAAKPFPTGWWDNFTKLLPNLKDWKTGVLAFEGNVITEANGLPSAAVDQIKTLFTGWKLPDVFGNVAETVRELAEVSLPDGTKLRAYPGGIEDQLVKFIQSDEYKSGTNDSLKDRWFNFDDLNFEFGTTNLTPESKRQLDNIVAILKAFPDVKIKVGGYTDKKGDDAANLKLSDSRAKAVQAALQKAGVGDQVPEAEGYGEQFATVDENASDKEREIDRKTAVRLLK